MQHMKHVLYGIACALPGLALVLLPALWVKGLSSSDIVQLIGAGAVTAFAGLTYHLSKQQDRRAQKATDKRVHVLAFLMRREIEEWFDGDTPEHEFAKHVVDERLTPAERDFRALAEAASGASDDVRDSVLAGYAAFLTGVRHARRLVTLVGRLRSPDAFEDFINEDLLPKHYFRQALDQIVSILPEPFRSHRFAPTTILEELEAAERGNTS